MSSIPYFLRAFRVVIHLQNGEAITVATTDNLLEAEFDIEYSRNVYCYCNLTMYNLDPATSTQIIGYGDTVEIYGGYQFNDGEQNLLFRGHVFQPLFEKENVVDTKLTLRCFIYLLEDQGSLVSVTLAPGSNGLDAFRAVAQAANLNATNIDESILRSKTYPAGVTFNERPTAALSRIASDCSVNSQNANVWFWVDSAGANIRSIAKQPGQQPDAIYTPSNNGIDVLPASQKNAKPTILGSPQQTQQGIEFTVLLDSTIRIGTAVQLVNVNIIQQQRTVNGTRFPPITADGIYIVCAFRHYGSTRFGNWATDVIAVTNPLLAYALN